MSQVKFRAHHEKLRDIIWAPAGCLAGAAATPRLSPRKLSSFYSSSIPRVRVTRVPSSMRPLLHALILAHAAQVPPFARYMLHIQRVARRIAPGLLPATLTRLSPSVFSVHNNQFGSSRTNQTKPMTMTQGITIHNINEKVKAGCY
jgi:hypothetical protein